MGSAQSVIEPYGQPMGFAGQVTHEVDGDSAANKEASLNIGFGLGVKPGTNLKEALLPTTGCLLKGITKNTMVGAPGTFGTVDQTSAVKGMIPNSMMGLLTEGRCFVEVDADANPTVGAGAYLRYETDGASNTKRGVFRETDDGHVVDVTKQVTFKSAAFSAADVLSGGTTKIAEVYISVSNKK